MPSSCSAHSPHLDSGPSFPKAKQDYEMRMHIQKTNLGRLILHGNREPSIHRQCHGAGKTGQSSSATWAGLHSNRVRLEEGTCRSKLPAWGSAWKRPCCSMVQPKTCSRFTTALCARARSSALSNAARSRILEKGTPADPCQHDRLHHLAYHHTATRHLPPC